MSKLVPVPACAECGMVLVNPTEYHPFAACLMYKQTKNAGTVRDNLGAVLAHRQRIATIDEVDAACSIVLAKRRAGRGPLCSADLIDGFHAGYRAREKAMP